MTEPNELLIIKEVLAGKVAAFATLVNNYKELAFSIAYNILLNREDAEEITQDAFVKAYTYLPTFKGQSRFSTWLYRIVVNTALNRRKTQKKQTLELQEEHDEIGAGYSTAIATGSVNEQKKYIQQALSKLADNERLCISLFYLHEMSVEEIRELTGISTSNIKVLLFRGRKNLYNSLHLVLKDEITNLV